MEIIPPRRKKSDEDKSEEIKAIANVLSTFLLIIIFAFPIAFLWTLFLPNVFNNQINKISYWQAVYLNSFVYLISKISRC